MIEIIIKDFEKDENGSRFITSVRASYEETKITGKTFDKMYSKALAFARSQSMYYLLLGFNTVIRDNIKGYIWQTI